MNELEPKAKTDIEILLEALKPFARAAKLVKSLGSPHPGCPLYGVILYSDGCDCMYEMYKESIDLGDSEDKMLIVQDLINAALAVDAVQGG